MENFLKKYTFYRAFSFIFTIACGVCAMLMYKITPERTPEFPIDLGTFYFAMKCFIILLIAGLLAFLVDATKYAYICNSIACIVRGLSIWALMEIIISTPMLLAINPTLFYLMLAFSVLGGLSNLGIFLTIKSAEKEGLLEGASD